MAYAFSQTTFLQLVVLFVFLCTAQNEIRNFFNFDSESERINKIPDQILGLGSAS